MFSLPKTKCKSPCGICLSMLSLTLYFYMFTPSHGNFMALHVLTFKYHFKELWALICLLLQDRKYVTVKNRVLSPEFRGRMVSLGLEVLNLLFIRMKITVLLLYYVINILQKKTLNDAGLSLSSLSFWNKMIYIFALYFLPCYACSTSNLKLQHLTYSQIYSFELWYQ